jgi:hypothetical protein
VTGAVTTTLVDADCVVSATLVAVTAKVPVLLGAVYTPAEEILPPVVAQVTDVFAQPELH